MMLHRVNANGDTTAWCGRTIDLNQHDGAWDPLSDPAFAGFVLCQDCCAMHGDVLPKHTKKPKVVHSPGPCLTPYSCGSILGMWSSELSEEQCARDQVHWTLKLVPCRKCMALKNVPKAPTPVAKIDDGFNDNCLRCGMRVYVGATPAAFEHQGGPCTGQMKWTVR